jgi:short-subunit dehydrogenase
VGNYSGKTVLITGASSGIGEALAREFASQGANLVLLARRLDRLTALAATLSTSGGGRAIAIQADVSKDGELERAVVQATTLFGRIDVVVANAGFAVAGSFERLTVEDFRRQFDVNVFGVLRTIYATLGELKNTRGRIALIGSVASAVSSPGATPYSMSKFALAGLSDGLNAELSRSGVSVTLVMPGFIDTNIFDVSNRNEPARIRGKNRPPNWLVMPADKAARKIAAAISARKRRKVITLHGKFVVALSRYFPGLLAWTLKRYARTLGK